MSGPREHGAAERTPLEETLAGHRPRTAAEAADTERIRALSSLADPWSRSTPLHLTASALIVHPASRRVLLRWHQREQGWLQVGGHGEPGETDPLAVALREAREESGLEDLVPWPDSGLLHALVVPVSASATEPAHEHADLRFVLATGTPDAVRPENPAARLTWLTFADATRAVGEDNVRETIRRLVELFD